MTNGKAEYLKNWHKKRMNADPIEYKLDTMLRGAKNRARTKRLRFNLHIDYVRTIAKEYCPYFPEIKLAYKTDKRKGWNLSSPSLDRIIPEKGYIEGNVEIISMKANLIKSSAASIDLYRVADRLYEFERDNEVLSILPSESLDEYKQRVGYYNPTNLVGYSYTRFLRFVNNKILRGLK